MSNHAVNSFVEIFGAMTGNTDVGRDEELVKQCNRERDQRAEIYETSGLGDGWSNGGGFA
jgi:hypothetical protein